jgi:hypothetical protein
MRTTHFWPLLLAVTAMVCASCGDSQQVNAVDGELSANLDRLCAWTGMTRAGPIKSIKYPDKDDSSYVVSVELAVGKRIRAFRLWFDSDRQLERFMPDDLRIEVGVGNDTLHDSQARDACMAAVRRLNEHLGWKWHSGPAIQKIGQDFLVTYQTLSDEQMISTENDTVMISLDPYVSFLVTPSGVVFGALWGA